MDFEARPGAANNLCGSSGANQATLIGQCLGRSKGSWRTLEARLHGDPCDRIALHAKEAPDRDKQQRWMTFLRNHGGRKRSFRLITAMDFFVVPTVSFRLLYVWFVIDHGRRRIIHFNVTSNPTATWVSQQLREAFPEVSAPRYLILDNDSIFSDDVSRSINSLGITPKRTAFRSPWQNGTAERWVGTCKRELIDHVVVLGEDHLRRLLRDYVNYYNADRVHTRLADAPEGRLLEVRPSFGAKVAGLARVGVIHHRYIWQEAA